MSTKKQYVPVPPDQQKKRGVKEKIFSMDDIQQILQDKNYGLGRKRLAEKYGLSEYHIDKILRNAAPYLQPDGDTQY